MRPIRLYILAAWVKAGLALVARNFFRDLRCHHACEGKVFLNVPFAEKDAAKSLGARWDATRKKWYVPQGVDIDQFGHWMAG